MARGLIVYQDDAVTTPGAVYGWKIAFGSTDKGTVVVVYRRDERAQATEVPLAANGRANLSAVQAALTALGGPTLPSAARTLIGA